jgi:hypothetical protein
MQQVHFPQQTMLFNDERKRPKASVKHRRGNGEHANRYQATVRSGNVIVMQSKEGKSAYPIMHQPRYPSMDHAYIGSNMRPPFGMPAALRAPLLRRKRLSDQPEKPDGNRPRPPPPTTAAMSFDRVIQHVSHAG